MDLSVRKTTQSLEVLTDKKIKTPSAHGPASSHPTSAIETFMHLLRGNVGSGLFAMGDAFKNGGLILGSVLTFFLGIICVHNQHILLLCSQKVKDKLDDDEDPDFAETVEYCFKFSSERFQKYARSIKILINIFICVTQLGFCCVYVVFASTSLKQVLDFYNIEWELRIHMVIVLLPILLPSLITELKYLAPLSIIANVCMAFGIGVVLYFAIQDIPSISERNFSGTATSIPLYFGTAMFAFEGIALVLPLKNAMKNPASFDKPVGVLNVGIGIVTMLYIFCGFFGYLKWGDEVQGSLTLNIPRSSVIAQVVKLSVGIGMIFTYALQFFVPIQIMMPMIEEKFVNQSRSHPRLLELFFRTLLVFVTFTIANLVPHLNIFISLIGAFCSTALALFFPPLCEIILSLGTTEGPSKIMLFKNILMIIIALAGFFTGTYQSMYELIKAFGEDLSP